ncbi:hypothetical protein GC425_01750 [Corynebacterium sp. zg254]|uniref:Lipoprotein LpqH n=1 Tax=Corynebacterium zhongnanshanii TaxID=2768834 RepID=A0ABQ6VG43_9CORY|nr:MULTISPECIES: lipoprotein LpqH [Corynebacterium]KAB3523283.1 lipoprotein LpqH [Corynebacterium zhongnanshanii]MCR5913596.1 hypothetical protein [Corynebacterium sp. zg254]
MTTHISPTFAKRLYGALGASVLLISLGACGREEARAVMYTATLDGEQFQTDDPTVTCTDNGGLKEITVGHTRQDGGEDATPTNYITALINPDGTFVEDITISDNSTFNFTYSPYRKIGSASAGESDGTYSIKGEGQMTRLDNQDQDTQNQDDPEKLVPFELELTCPSER